MLPLPCLSTQVSICLSIHMCTYTHSHSYVAPQSIETVALYVIWFEVILRPKSLLQNVRKIALYLTLKALMIRFMMFFFPYMFFYELLNYPLILGMHGYRWGTLRLGIDCCQGGEWAPKCNLSHVSMFLRISLVHTAVSVFLCWYYLRIFKHIHNCPISQWF